MCPVLSRVRAVPPVLALLLLARAGSAEEFSQAPSFQAKDLEGAPVRLEELLRGGPVLVDFWATWCKPCIKELPFLQRLHERYAEQGLTVLAVSIDSPKSLSRVAPFVRGRKFTFRVLLDPDQSLFRKLQGRGSVPYAVVIDSRGGVRYRHTGYRPGDEKKLEQVILEILGEAARAKAPPEEAGA